MPLFRALDGAYGSAGFMLKTARIYKSVQGEYIWLAVFRCNLLQVSLACSIKCRLNMAWHCVIIRPLPQRGGLWGDRGMTKKLDRVRGWMLLILAGVILVNIKRLFIDFSVDCEYAIAMSYRMARGDYMITQMWEPHQTSAFLNSAFIWLYMLLTGTTTGIALYLNGVGLLAKLGVAFAFCRTLRRDIESRLLFLMCAFFMTVNAKDIIILDFSNMMIYFSILCFCALYVHLRKQGAAETVFLMLAAVCFCLEVLSYPSAIILFPLMLAILNRYSVFRCRDMVLFSGTCIVIGSTFIGFLLIRTGWERFWPCVRNIVTGDSPIRWAVL